MKWGIGDLDLIPGFCEFLFFANTQYLHVQILAFQVVRSLQNN